MHDATPFPAFAPLTISASDGTGSTTVRDYVTSSIISTSNGTPVYSTSTVSNMTTQTGGHVIADPIVVAWQEKDLAAFPTAYASSLASMIGVTFTATPKASPGIPGPTGTPTTTNSQSNPTSNSKTGLQLGAKLGITFGALVAFALLCALAIFMIRRQKGKRNMSVSAGSDHEPIARTSDPYVHERMELGQVEAKREHPVELAGRESVPSPKIREPPPVELEGYVAGDGKRQ